MKLFVVAAALLLTTPTLADDAMHATAAGFYGVLKTTQPRGVPDDADRAKLAPYLSPTLEASLKAAADAEARFAKANKDSPPLVEGDLFSSLFEGITAFEVKACTGDAAKGSCAVALTYDDHHDKPAQWTDTVYLVKTPAGWRVDDIGYGGDWAFGNKGRLSETLKQVLSF